MRGVPVHPGDLGAARVGGFESDQDAGQGALAGAGFPDDPQLLPGRDAEAHAVDGLQEAASGQFERLADVGRLQHGPTRLGDTDGRFRLVRVLGGVAEPTPAGRRRRHGPQQLPGVLVARVAEHLGGRPRLDQDAVAHHQDAVGDPRDDGQVVGDEQQRRPGVAPLREEVEDLRLHRHVERGGRLVGDEQVGLPGDGGRNQRPLPQPARELVRILVGAHGGVGEADEFQAGQDPVADLVTGHQTMRPHDLGDLLADGAQRVERTQGVLQDEPDVTAAELAPAGFGQRTHVAAVDPELGRGDLRPRTGQADQRPGGHGLARAGLTDQRDRLAGLDRQVDAADGVHLAAASLEPDLQVADLQDGLGGGGLAHRFLRS